MSFIKVLKLGSPNEVLGNSFVFYLNILSIKVCIAARGVNKLEELKKEIEEEGATCALVKCDVVNREDVHKMVQCCENQLGSCDILVNNAGKTF